MDDAPPSPAGHTGTARLFLALWPQSEALDALARWRGQWQWPAGAALTPRQRLHMTLHFIGPVPLTRLASLRRALAVPLRAFDLDFDAAEVWPRGLAVLAARQVPDDLARLHQGLARALREAGLPVVTRALRAHVTLARRAGGALPPPAAPALRWRVSAYSLVRSAGGYTELERYRAEASADPAAGAAAAACGAGSR